METNEWVSPSVKEHDRTTTAAIWSLHPRLASILIDAATIFVWLKCTETAPDNSQARWADDLNVSHRRPDLDQQFPVASGSSI